MWHGVLLDHGRFNRVPSLPLWFLVRRRNQRVLSIPNTSTHLGSNPAAITLAYSSPDNDDSPD